MTENLIKQLKPEKFEHWELISRRPKPSLRVFGRFAKPNVFVGTYVRERRGLGKRGRNNLNWKSCAARKFGKRRVCLD